MDIVSDSWSAEQDKLSLCRASVCFLQICLLSLLISHEKLYETFDCLGGVASHSLWVKFPSLMLFLNMQMYILSVELFAIRLHYDQR